MKAPIKVAITGAAGQIGYALLPRIASGQVFGADQPVILHLIEIEPVLPALEGVVMELEDGAFPLLRGVVATASSDVGFNGVNWVIFVGGIPRKDGMERKDLLQVNGKMFVGQGKALEKNAASDVRVLMVANPANTNALILAHNAPSIPKDRITAMTRLDENRAKTQLAKKAGTTVDQVTNLAVWGNHSATQYPDFVHAKIGGKKATDVITDRAWLEGEFITMIQQRGAAVIKARKSSSAFSAANAAIDSVRSILEPTPKGDWHSVCVWSDGNPYGVAKGLVTSFPVRSNGGGHWEIVSGLELDPFSKSKIDASNKELEDERAMVADLIPK